MSSFKYTCSRCKYTTNSRQCYERHLSRKRPCTPIEEVPIDTHVVDDGENKISYTKTQDGKFKCLVCKRNYSSKQNVLRHTCRGSLDILQCEWCEKKFASKSSKSQHRKICKLRPSNVERLDASHNAIHITNNITNNNINFQPTINYSPIINIVPFTEHCKDLVDKISLEEIHELFIKSDDLFSSLFYKFYIQKPEYRNILNTNTRHTHAQVVEKHCMSDALYLKTMTKKCLFDTRTLGAMLNVVQEYYDDMTNPLHWLNKDVPSKLLNKKKKTLDNQMEKMFANDEELIQQYIMEGNDITYRYSGAIKTTQKMCQQLNDAIIPESE